MAPNGTPAPDTAATLIPLDDVLDLVDELVHRERAANGGLLPGADFDTRVERAHRYEEATELGAKFVAALCRRYA